MQIGSELEIWRGCEMNLSNQIFFFNSINSSAKEHFWAVKAQGLILLLHFSPRILIVGTFCVSRKFCYV